MDKSWTEINFKKKKISLIYANLGVNRSMKFWSLLWQIAEYAYTLDTCFW
jgi:hypothetical protein